jgi:hypothetical protein
VIIEGIERIDSVRNPVERRFRGEADQDSGGKPITYSGAKLMAFSTDWSTTPIELRCVGIRCAKNEVRPTREGMTTWSPPTNHTSSSSPSIRCSGLGAIVGVHAASGFSWESHFPTVVGKKPFLLLSITEISLSIADC